jgi:hypothetical protein
MADDSFRSGLFDFTIAHFNRDLFTAIEAWGFDTHLFSWEKPADRQRFKGSLSKPFLLAVNRDPKLGGLIVERSEGSD